MSEPTPLTLYLGQSYAVTVAEPPPPFVNGGLIIDPWDGLEKRLTESPYARPVGWDAVRAVHGLRLVRAGL